MTKVHGMASDSLPTVSMMMPAYNCEKYVGEAIERIINQTYTNWELVCVDDGSTHRTLEIMQEYAADDPRIRVYANEENRGRPYTRNRIIELARGSILACQDADDIALPRRLEEGTSILAAEPGIAVVASGWIEIDEDGQLTGRRKPPLLLRGPLEEILTGEGVPFCHGSALMRTEAVRAVGGYDEFFEMGPDIGLVRRLAERHEFRAVDRPWYKYRKHPGQLTTTKAHLQEVYGLLSQKRLQAFKTGKLFDLQAEFNRLKAELEQDLSDDKLKARACYQMGIFHILSGKLAAARNDFTQALYDRGLFARALMGYVLTLAPAIIRVPTLRAYSWLKHQ